MRLDTSELVAYFGVNPRCRREGCSEYATDLHHIKPKARGGSDSLHNLMPLCRDHHAWAHAYALAAHDAGLLLWSWEDERAA